MNSRRSAAVVAVVALLAVALLGYTLYPALAVTVVGPPADYERTTVTAYDAASGERLGSVDARVADDRVSRYAGLSYTEDLSADEGMWFVHDDTDSRTYVMRGMSFDIDIVFASANGTVTAVHHAAAPTEGQSGETLRYGGEGKYVLEVPYEWTDRHDVSVGDCLDAAGEETTCAPA